VAYDLRQARFRHPVDHLFGSKRPLPGGAPYVDALGVEDQDPGVRPRRIAANGVEGQFIVGGDQDRRVPVRDPERVQSRRDAVSGPCRSPTGPSTAEDVTTPILEWTRGTGPAGVSTIPSMNPSS